MAVIANPSLVVVCEISSSTTSREVRGARQLMEIKEKSRCSILFQGHGGRWVMHHRDGQLFFIGQLLQFLLPQAVLHPIGTAPIRSDQQLRLAGIERLATGLSPASDTLHRELGRLVVNAHIHEATFPGQFQFAHTNCYRVQRYRYPLLFSEQSE
jgi:hypothetical protein